VIPAAVLGTGRAAGARCVPTETVLDALAPEHDRARLRARLGITTRAWAGPGETLATLAAAALREALAAAALPATALRRVILATSTGGDQLTPSTANSVLAALGLDDSCDAFDLNNACVGFLTGLDLAARIVATGGGPVAVIGAELFSRYLAPEQPRTWLVLADAAAACIVGESVGGAGVRGVSLRNNAVLREQMHIPHPGVTRTWRPVSFHAPAWALAESAVAAIRQGSDAALAQARLGWDDVDWFLPHQPNGVMFDAIVAGCGVPRAKVVPVAAEIGSVGAAAVPYSLDVLSRSGRLRPGQHVLLAAVGAGTAYGALLYRAAA
jgi:3-oxoacyl-(acyl-carrier-protein) synthase III